ncbi:MAG: hypothetical protein GKS07_11015 [Nitrosopumilus sp.]|nr:MAG: hypothetical protein GKS07_00580 [Nitrosopumilus sp.]QMU55372.1 MAG: hypothetical protein GKS07_11015 [Nitrosopumilus sp.]
MISKCDNVYCTICDNDQELSKKLSELIEIWLKLNKKRGKKHWIRIPFTKSELEFIVEKLK